MNLLKQMIKKEFLHIIRDPRSLLIIFILPIIQILLFGYVITNEIKNMRIAIYDKSFDNTTAKIKSKIIGSGYFQYKGEVLSNKEIEEKFKTGEIDEVIVFEENFATKLYKYNKANIQLILDASDPNTAKLIGNYTIGIIQDYIKEINKNISLPLNITIIPSMLYNPELKSAFVFVPGVMAVILTLISALMTSIALTREKEFKTIEMLLISPFKSSHIIIGKVIPYAIISIINVILIIILSTFFFDLPIRGNIWLLLAESFLFVLTALSLGILISTVADNQLKAMLMSSVGLLMPTMLLSGFIFPLEHTPKAIQLLSNIVPAKWFIIIIKNIMFKGIGIEYYWKETLILITMMLFILLISTKKFKDRLE